MSLPELGALIRRHPRVLLTGKAAPAVHEALRESGTSSGPGELIVDRGERSTDPGALLELGKLELTRSGPPAEEPQPLYLRKSDAEISRLGG